MKSENTILQEKEVKLESISDALDLEKQAIQTKVDELEAKLLEAVAQKSDQRASDLHSMLSESEVSPKNH